MSNITIQKNTTKNPISLIGYEAGVCWNGDISNDEKNFKRGLNCIKNNHGRTLEFPQIYMTIDGYSAKVLRELYTHIGGAPSRMQASTRYIDYKNFKTVVPHTIKNNKDALETYNDLVSYISETIIKLKELGIPNEDATMILPLSMCSKMVIRTNLRQLIDMSRQRMCNRAYWEFRELMSNLISELSNYSSEWNVLITELNVFHPKCEELGFCPESNTCGRKHVKGE